MDANTVQKIADISQTGVVNLNDGQFTTRPVFNTPLPEEPKCDTLTVATLDGLVEYYNSQMENEEIDPLIHIFSPWRVYLISPISGVKRQRETYVKAAYDEKFIFDFGEFHDHAETMIQLQSKFMRTADMEKVLKCLGTIKGETVKGSTDDGISQRVTAAAGIILDEVKVPNPVNLVPYRTFNEVKQPASDFILRLDGGRPGGLPRVAFFEADAGTWKLEAIGNIREYLKNALPEVAIIA